MASLFSPKNRYHRSMTYISTLLHPHEKILLSARISYLPAMHGFFLLVLYLLFVGLLGYDLMQETGIVLDHYVNYFTFPEGYASLTDQLVVNYPDAALIAGLFRSFTHGLLIVAVLLFAFLITLRGLIYRYKTELVITNLRVVARIGWLARDLAELHHQSVQDLFLTQSFAGRLFNFGSIYLRGYAGDIAYIGYVSDPVRFRSAALEIMESGLHPA